MRIKALRWVVGVVGAMLLGSVAGAQSAEPACSMGFTNVPLALGDRGNGTKPYTATAKTTYEHQLADGNSIHAYILTRLARDAAGRTMNEHPFGCWRDENGVLQAWTLITVADPSAKTGMTWSVTGSNLDKTAHVFHQVPRKPLTPEEQEARQKRMQTQQAPRAEWKSEDLGTRTIAGVEARGQRTLRTIPAGEDGNELPLVITDEEWFAKDLGVEVMAVRDDPRVGRSTFEVQEITVGQPDASLFAPPAGYKIVDDQNPQADSATKP